MPPEGLAVVLVPAGVTLFRQGELYRAELGYYRRGREKYAGPARVFLPPGERIYDVEVDVDGERSVIPIRIVLRPGHGYDLQITLTSDDVEWALVPVAPETYARAHAGDPAHPRLPGHPAPTAPVPVRAGYGYGR